MDRRRRENTCPRWDSNRAPTLEKPPLPPKNPRSGPVIDQRIALLQGLLDSDGCAAKQGIIFVGRERLSRDVFQLLFALGERPTIAFSADARSRDTGTWRLSFNPRYVTECFRLARKQAKVVRATCAETYIASIEPVESVPVRRIRVDAKDSLFQAGESCQLTDHWTPGQHGPAFYELTNNPSKVEGRLLCMNASTVDKLRRYAYLDMPEQTLLDDPERPEHDS
ncbi:hypothetical protein [Arthrobacter sp. NPDC057013]|uniref:hypothetical protein n=1 Tax=Arthrobacter sp. NPDC057013 TaxID=3345999 RepID=UPI0036424DE9